MYWKVELHLFQADSKSQAGVWRCWKSFVWTHHNTWKRTTAKSILGVLWISRLLCAQRKSLSMYSRGIYILWKTLLRWVSSLFIWKVFFNCFVRNDGFQRAGWFSASKRPIRFYKVKILCKVGKRLLVKIALKLS